nr:uncharacterized protein CTRU02_05102 [Colletotrichum truncatum]KAF6794901.1 hypothetical protein CTRU02_05102 [Colletotrichum truncatum]
MHRDVMRRGYGYSYGAPSQSSSQHTVRDLSPTTRYLATGAATSTGTGALTIAFIPGNASNASGPPLLVLPRSLSFGLPSSSHSQEPPLGLLDWKDTKPRARPKQLRSPSEKTWSKEVTARFLTSPGRENGSWMEMKSPQKTKHRFHLTPLPSIHPAIKMSFCLDFCSSTGRLIPRHIWLSIYTPLLQPVAQPCLYDTSSLVSKKAVKAQSRQPQSRQDDATDRRESTDTNG